MSCWHFSSASWSAECTEQLCAKFSTFGSPHQEETSPWAWKTYGRVGTPLKRCECKEFRDAGAACDRDKNISVASQLHPRRGSWHPWQGTSHPNPFFGDQQEPVQFAQGFEELTCCAISAAAGLLGQDQGCLVLSPSRRADKSL